MSFDYKVVFVLVPAHDLPTQYGQYSPIDIDTVGVQEADMRPHLGEGWEGVSHSVNLHTNGDALLSILARRKKS